MNHAKIGAMITDRHGQANLTAILALIGLIVASVWAWKRLTPDTQDYVIEQAVPVAVAVAVVGILGWRVVSYIRRRRSQVQVRSRLIARFQRETVASKRRDLAFELIEVNRYTLKGLESVAPALVEVLMTTLKTALGDKRHRIRGMAASYLGVLQDRQVIPLLLRALEDDHAHVRACAALGLGRLNACEAKDRLTAVMQDDWDQTVRSRAREALERMG
ncbi:HEAT repeat domain-containing protein [Nitrospira sp. Nam74]